ncbi:lipase 3-like [Ostrinia nubilalis]|uniref:lipase 3-like n=1 Tax=Ostrinia nubilalis TaxID=29057 RepID=UPI003082652E
MKAVCLLVCLALAHQCAGSIFNPYQPRIRGSRVQQHASRSADYVDPYLQEQYSRYLPTYAQQVYRQTEEKHAPVYTQVRKQNYVYEEPRILRSNMAVNDDYEHIQYEEDSTNESQKISKHSDSSVISKSNEIDSQEAIKPQNRLENFDQQYFAPMFADMGPLTRMKVSFKKQPEALHGDPTMWRNLKMASSEEWPVEKKDLVKIFSEAMKAMKHIQPEAKTKLHKAVEVASQEDMEDSHLNATELLKKYQYPVEEHTVKTDDGYYLTLFRISGKQSIKDVPRPVVFLMHGLLGSADDWLLMGPGKSLPYLLADAGYDVWLGNARGNKYTRHVSKSRAQPDFWQYSNDDIALHDLPAMIDYVLEESKTQNMYYIGHSSGTTALFALLSTRPEYNDKIVMMHALSPMAYMSHVRSPLLRMIEPSSRFHERVNHQLGQGEFKPSEELVRTMGGVMCENEIGCKNVCSNVYFVMSGVNAEHLEPKQIPSIMKHLPAGASTKQMQQYGQTVAAHEFKMYDYGVQMNEKVYGKPQPPKYQLDKVSVPVALYYSEHDWLAHPKDVKRLERELPIAMSKKIQEDYFSHGDFQFSKKAPELVYKHVLDSIQKQHQKLEEQDKSVQ